MQTFLPYPEFGLSASVVDNKRLGKQRVEAMQLIDCLCDLGSQRWGKHPAAKMWRGHVMSLALYYNQIRAEWIRRGCVNNMPLIRLTDRMVKPPWLGDPTFHASHRSNLLRKGTEDATFRLYRKDGPKRKSDWTAEDYERVWSKRGKPAPDWYDQFGWEEPDDLPYVWPV